MVDLKALAENWGLLDGAEQIRAGLWEQRGEALCHWAEVQQDTPGTILRERAAVELSTAFMETQIYEDYLRKALWALPEETPVLELGAGDGRITRMLLGLGLRVIACDCNLPSLLRLQDSLDSKERAKALLLRGDVQTMRLVPGRIPAIMAIEVLSYLGPAFESVLSGLVGALTPNGLLVHSEPTLEGSLIYALLEEDWDLVEALGAGLRQHPHGYRVFTPQELLTAHYLASAQRVGNGYTPLVNPVLVHRLSRSGLKKERQLGIARAVRLGWTQYDAVRCLIHTLTRTQRDKGRA